MLKLATILMVCSACLTIAGQEAPSRTASPCISPADEVYTVESDHIKPAMPLKTPRPERKRSQAQFTLELVVNVEGAVCSARVLRVMSTGDQTEAAEMAAFIPGHWTFKPATIKGKPVAFKFVTNFTARQ